jgi:hypothetical protein
MPCFGCGNKRFRINWAKIAIAHSGFSGFAYSNGDSETCSGSDTNVFGDWTWNGTQYYKSPNEIPTELDLWQQPSDTITNGYGASGSFTPSGTLFPCQWLWNDVAIYNTIGHRVAVTSSPYSQVHSEIEVGTPYEPVNAIDPASPWNRVITPITDSRCGTKVIPSAGSAAVRWECYSMPVTTYIALRILTINTSETITDTITTSGVWAAPSTISGNITVEVWGGGGGGGGSDEFSGSSPGGGGGGAYARKVITPSLSTIYTTTIGTGGAGGTSSINGADGGDTWFDTSSNVKAVGGKGGTSATLDDDEAGGAGGTAASSVGTTKYSGGAGADGVSGSHSGGGGSSAGTASNGAAASGGTGGTAPGGGGNGGNQGASGNVPGGGGGGAIAGSNSSGAAGAHGQIKITYTIITSRKVWDLRVGMQFGTVKVTNRSYTGQPENDPHDAVMPFVNPFVFGGSVPVESPAGPYTCFPFEDDFPNGAGFAVYQKDVECNEDFNGDPIVLEFQEDGYVPRRDTIFGVTCPPTITMTLTPA